MIAPSLVLVAVLFCLAAIVVSSVSLRKRPKPDESSINSLSQLDAAVEMQRYIKIANLRQRATGQNYLAIALVGLAFLAQIAALAVDHFAHVSVSVVSILPAMVAVFVGQAAKRRIAKRELEAYLKGQLSS